ncbi:MAG TPA: hypothetical protein VLZ11_03215 [Flavobacterium sp.]|nr:hypothetical protein [Flavobacterium sp.]
MNKYLLFFTFFISSMLSVEAQGKYEYVIVPGNMSFLNEPNQYNLNELAKFLTHKKNVIAYFDSEIKPLEFNIADPCDILYMDITKENAFLNTKLKITLTDCNKEIIAESFGTSKEKEHRVAYNYAIREAFDLLHIPAKIAKKINAEIVEDTSDPTFLYAQKTGQGFLLLDSEQNEVYKLFKTSKADQFIISNKEINGALYKSKTPNEWVLEYLKQDTIVTDTLKIRF